MASLEFGDEVQIGDDVQGTVAADAAPVSVADLRSRGLVPSNMLIQIVKHVAEGYGDGDVTLPPPVHVIGLCRGRRLVIGELNEGLAIVVGLGGGYQQLVNAVALCEALVIIPGGALTGDGTPAFDAYAIAVWEM